MCLVQPDWPDLMFCSVLRALCCVQACSRGMFTSTMCLCYCFINKWLESKYLIDVEGKEIKDKHFHTHTVFPVSAVHTMAYVCLSVADLNRCRGPNGHM